MNDTERIDELENNVEQISTKLTSVERTINDINKEEVTLGFPLSIRNKQVINSHIVFPVVVSLQGSAASTSSNYDVFYTADNACEIVSVSETHRVAGTDAGSVTINIEKLNSGESLDSGDVALTTSLSLKTTINTPQFGNLLNGQSRILSKGDRIALKDSGTLTSVSGVVVTVHLRMI